MLGTEKIEKLVDALAHVAVAAKKISNDKKVDLQDIPAAMEVLVKIPEIVSAFSELGQAFDEAKDLDVAEVVSLIKKVDEKVKLIEKA
jgi:hypothetical protein